MTGEALAHHNAERVRLGLAPIAIGGVVPGDSRILRNDWVDGDRFVRTADLVDATLEMASRLPADVDLVVAIPRSGLIPGSILAAHLHVPLATIRGNQIEEVGRGVRLDGERSTPRRVLLIDDTAAGGREMARRTPIVRQRFPDSAITRAVIYTTPEAVHAIDLAVAIVPGPHWLEWNWQNAGHGIGCVYDFDGILCRDCRPEEDDDGPRYRDFLATATPLYLPRRRMIHTIATARHEKYRAETLDWLDRHNVRVEHLVMRDWDYSPDVSHAEQVGRWKAHHYVRSGQPLFAESCPEQSRWIADHSGKRVLCPAAGRLLHPARPAAIVRPIATNGPGTELRRLIARLDGKLAPFRWVIAPSAPALAATLELRDHSGCGCQAFGDWMDSIGVTGCRDQSRLIARHLARKAAEQGLRLPVWAASLLVRRAISSAERLAGPT